MSTEKFVELIEQSMKSGYISMLILLALEKKPANGYKLMKMISEDTFGAWKPTNATMYPYLSNLTKRKIIQFEKKKTGQRESKEYSLTTKGRVILKMLVEKQQEMNLSLLSMITTVLDVKNLPSNLLDFFNQSFQEVVLIDKSKDQKIEILSRRIEIMNLILEIMGKNKIAMQKELDKLKKIGN